MPQTSLVIQSMHYVHELHWTATNVELEAIDKTMYFMIIHL